MNAEKIKVGDRLLLREHGHGFKYAVLPPGVEGQEVIEVGSDFVLLRGADGADWVRYPAFLLSEGAQTASTNVPEAA
jgi:hypothetical protein